MFIDIEIKKGSVTLKINDATPADIKTQIENDLNFLGSINTTLKSVFKIYTDKKYIDETLNPEGVYFSMATVINTYKIPLHLIRSINSELPSPGPLFDPQYIFDQYNLLFP